MSGIDYFRKTDDNECTAICGENGCHGRMSGHPFAFLPAVGGARPSGLVCKLICETCGAPGVVIVAIPGDDLASRRYKRDLVAGLEALGAIVK